MENCTTLKIFEKRCLLQVQPGPKPAAKGQVELRKNCVCVCVKGADVLFEMGQQTVEPKYPEVVKSNIYFFKGFRDNFVDEVEGVGVARNVAHHQIGYQNVVLRVSVVQFFVALVCR